MNIIQFIALVAEMRQTQYEYLRLINTKNLKRMIELEMRVDKIIKEGKFFLPQDRVINISDPQVEN